MRLINIQLLFNVQIPYHIYFSLIAINLIGQVDVPKPAGGTETKIFVEGKVYPAFITDKVIH